jgi:HK97 family phage prohead protease
VTELMERAALARREALREPADRPQERRCSEQSSFASTSRAVTRRPIEVREASTGTGLDFTGYASVTEAPYEMYDSFGPYTEVVTRGAFSSSLNRADLDVPLVLNHDSLRRIARTSNGSLTLTEDETGLRADAPGLDPGDQDVAYIAPKLRSGLVDEMSFRFSIDSGKWSPDYSEFRIDSANIHRGDVAIVGYGASPHTSSQLRAALESLTVVERAPSLDFTRAELAEIRAHEKAIRVELRRRGLEPAMSLLDLLAKEAS